MNGAFWHGKRVFITGHTGFKGGWLTLWLQHLGAEVTGYALPPATNPSFFESGKLAVGMTSIIGDICDRGSLHEALVAARPEIVLHLAAQPLVRQSYADPVETYMTNIMGTVHLLEAVRQCETVRAVVNVTTDKCYENREWHWGYREIDPLGGFDPYSSSKAGSELVTASYRNSFFNPAAHADHGVAIATARAGNVIGGGDWSEARLVPDILAAFGKSEPVVIRSPDAVRPWQHVLEPVIGYLTLAQALYEQGPQVGEAWNFGPYDEDVRPVRWIVERLAERYGTGATWKLDRADGPHEAGVLKLDCSKARARLGWSPRWNLPTALDAIVDWQQEFLQGADMRAFSLQQISKFSDWRNA